MNLPVEPDEWEKMTQGDSTTATKAAESAATVESTANIAFIKYWGARDLDEVVPENTSISMTLRECRSKCHLRFSPEREKDEVWLELDGARVNPGAGFSDRVTAHLDRLREWAGVEGGIVVETWNSFPAASGMASSASGFSALTCAFVLALGLEPTPAELSILSRRSGSGSAARSVFGGYVEWGRLGDGSAEQLHPASHWDLRDVIAVVETGEKEISSRDGHRLAATSPYFERRLELLPERLETTRRALREHDFGALGPVIEEEAIDLHLITMSSRPAIYYWKPPTLAVLEAVRDLRSRGVAAFSTMDAGANVHVICQPEDEETVAACLSRVQGVVRVIRDGVGEGPRRLD